MNGTAAMHWLLPTIMVLVVALLVAAIHHAFMRWMARQPEPATVRDVEGSECPEEGR